MMNDRVKGLLEGAPSPLPLPPMPTVEPVAQAEPAEDAAQSAPGGEVEVFPGDVVRLTITGTVEDIDADAVTFREHPGMFLFPTYRLEEVVKRAPEPALVDLPQAPHMTVLAATHNRRAPSTPDMHTLVSGEDGVWRELPGMHPFPALQVLAFTVIAAPRSWWLTHDGEGEG